jgi:DNA polymerase-3 subunit delta'
MNNLDPSSQCKLFGLNNYLLELIRFYKANSFPNKILLSGQKGIGKSTLAYHFFNYVLSENENHKYDIQNFTINTESSTFKTILNKTNTNLINVDISPDKKSIDINQIRELINNLNKSSFNDNPRFVLIDNIELLNDNSVNALLKVLEEPSIKVHFILINNNKRILSTLLSRCLNFKISLSNKESFIVANKLLDGNIEKFINKDLLNYYISPGNIYNLINFGNNNDYDLVNTNLENFLESMITNKHYKKDKLVSFIIFDFIELYFNKISFSLSTRIFDKYSYFLKKISDTKRFNLDEETLFTEFKEEILNG